VPRQGIRLERQDFHFAGSFGLDDLDLELADREPVRDEGETRGSRTPKPGSASRTGCGGEALVGDLKLVHNGHWPGGKQLSSAKCRLSRTAAVHGKR
jgi:hypothetical protein